MPASPRKSSARPASSADAAASTASFELNRLFGFLLHRLSASFATLAAQDALELAGLSLAEYRTLTVLASQGGMGVVALCRAMLVDKAWVSRTLARLVEKGLVLSNATADDARRTTYAVTASGRTLARRLIKRSLERQARFLEGLSAAEVRQLMDLLGRLQDNTAALTAERAAARD